MRYIVEITETLQKRIIVNADNEEEAQEMAEEIYYTGKEVLKAEDLIETEIEVIGEDIVYSITGSRRIIKFCIAKVEDGYKLLIKEPILDRTIKTYDEIYSTLNEAIEQLKKIQEKEDE